MSKSGTILYLDGVSRSFDGFKAINNLSLTLANYDFANFDASGWSPRRSSHRCVPAPWKPSRRPPIST